MRVLTGLVCALLLVSSAGAAETLHLDAEKSKIEFVGKKKDGQHTGGFKKFEAKASADLENPKSGQLEITIDANSLWSDDAKLTNHLKNPDFFDVRKYPKIVFKVTDMELDGSAVKLTGDLTMIGKTAKLTVPAQAELEDKTITVTAEFKLDRTKWGMNYGTGNIENEVAVKAVLVFNR